MIEIKKKLLEITLLSPINGYLLFLELLHPKNVQKIHDKFTGNKKGPLIMGQCIYYLKYSKNIQKKSQPHSSKFGVRVILRTVSCDVNNIIKAT